MSMLAEPRKKVVWSGNPRGKFWSDDSTKYGQRMLEKMGWSKGKGLGAKEQGIASHVEVKFKNDNKGVGFSKGDEWSKHIQTFEEVLSGLAKSEQPRAQPIRTTSPGETLKKSKVNLRYPKFIRGKDLSQYKKEDLKCIFGVKDNSGNEDSGSRCEVEDVGTLDNSFGVKTIVGGSMEDYLRKRHDSKTSKEIITPEDRPELHVSKLLKCKDIVSDINVHEGSAVGTVDESFGVKTVIGGSLEDYMKRKSIHIHPISGIGSCENAMEGKKELHVDDCRLVDKKETLLKRGKKRRSKKLSIKLDSDKGALGSITPMEDVEETEDHPVVSEKKQKISTSEDICSIKNVPLKMPIVENEEESQVLESGSPLRKKTKKKRKRMSDERNDDCVVANLVVDNSPVEAGILQCSRVNENTKDRISFNEDSTTVTCNEIPESQTSLTTSLSHKKKKKRTLDQTIEEMSLSEKPPELDECSSVSDLKQKKKKKKKKSTDSTSQENIAVDNVVTNHDDLLKEEKREKFVEGSFCEQKRKRKKKSKKFSSSHTCENSSENKMECCEAVTDKHSSSKCVENRKRKSSDKDKLEQKRGARKKRNARHHDLNEVDHYKPLLRKDITSDLLSLSMKMFVGSNIKKIIGYGNNLP